MPETVERHSPTLLLLAGVLAASNYTSAPTQFEFARQRLMERECDPRTPNSNLNVEIEVRLHPSQAYIHFSNKTQAPLWFPAEQEPAFRPDVHGNIVTIWFGYFDEVYGEYAGRYMVPPMRQVPPGNDLTVEIKAPALVQILLERRLSPHLEVRLATKELPASRTRGEQPLQDYIQHSCVVRSPTGAGSQ